MECFAIRFSLFLFFYLLSIHYRRDVFFFKPLESSEYLVYGGLNNGSVSSRYVPTWVKEQHFCSILVDLLKSSPVRCGFAVGSSLALHTQTCTFICLLEIFFQKSRILIACKLVLNYFELLEIRQEKQKWKKSCNPRIKMCLDQIDV